MLGSVEAVARSYGVPTYVIQQVIDEFNARNAEPSKYGDAVGRACAGATDFASAVWYHKRMTGEIPNPPSSAYFKSMMHVFPLDRL